MSTKENKKLIQRMIEEWNIIDGNVAKMRCLFDKYYVPGFVYHSVSSGDTNREQTIQNMITYLSAFPDVNYSIDDILTEVNKTAIRCTFRATHNGVYGNPCHFKKDRGQSG